MLVNIIRYTDGYVRVRVEGAMPERLLNLATREGIAVWGMKRGEGTLCAYTPARSYVRLLRLSRRAGAKVRVEKKYGLPFHINRYRRRIGLLAGAALFIFVLYGLSFFLWNVEISGQVDLTEEEIRATLSDMGVEPGAYRGTMDLQILADRLMTEYPALSWAAINIEGGNAYVTVREQETGVERVPTDQPCNIKATRDGVILSVEDTDGFAAVQAGEAVVKGDLLISGIWEDETGNSMLLHARGTVMAQTYRTERLEYPIQQELHLAAGAPVRCRRLELFGLSLPLSFTLPPDGAVSLERIETPVRVGKMHLPIKILQEEWTPLQPYYKEITEEEAAAAAEKRIGELKREWAEEEVKILDVKREITVTAQSFIFEYMFTCEENIALQDEIIVN